MFFLISFFILLQFYQLQTDTHRSSFKQVAGIPSDSDNFRKETEMYRKLIHKKTTGLSLQEAS